MPPLLTTDLGLISYTDAYALQQCLVAARKAGAIDDVLLLCEHPHVITLGRNANRSNLLASEHVLRQKGVELHSTNRGGDITYHGPGQIVGYPILNLDKIKRDVGWYVRTLEDAMIRASADFGVAAYRVPGKTGIWVHLGNLPGSTSSLSSVFGEGTASALPGSSKNPEVLTPEAAGATEEKLAAIGVHISRWVTSHGFAYNVSTDLRYFDLIVPCGIPDRKATSLEKLLSRNVALDEVKPRLSHHLAQLLSLEPRTISPDDLLSFVGSAF
ncbi:MAG: lipoyl(octanoyl) transferase [Candidatus Acidiferrum sp.]